MISFVISLFHQDGSYLAELLLDKGYIVHGIIRRSSSFNTGRIQNLYEDKNAHQTGSKCLISRRVETLKVLTCNFRNHNDGCTITEQHLLNVAQTVWKKH